MNKLVQNKFEYGPKYKLKKQSIENHVKTITDF